MGLAITHTHSGQAIEYGVWGCVGFLRAIWGEYGKLGSGKMYGLGGCRLPTVDVVKHFYRTNLRHTISELRSRATCAGDCALVHVVAEDRCTTRRNASKRYVYHASHPLYIRA